MGNTQQQRLTKHLQEVDVAISKRMKQDYKAKHQLLFAMMAGKGTETYIKKVIVCLLSATGEEVEYLKKMKENVQITTFKLAKKFLLKFCPKFSEEMRAIVTEVVEDEGALPTPPTLEKLLLLWNYETVKTLLGACTYSDLAFDESHLNLSAKLFLSNLPNIFSESYVPSSDEAVLSEGNVEYRCNQLTVDHHEGGYTDFSFIRDGRTYKYWKKHQRGGGIRYWANMMEGCNIILFVCPLTSYNRMLDEYCPEMKELHLLFEEITNSRFFHQAPVMLVFTERNSFEEETKWTSIKKTFDDYTGDPKSATESLEFIKTKFRSVVQRRNCSIYDFVVDMADEDKAMSAVIRRQIEILIQTNFMVM